MTPQEIEIRYATEAVAYLDEHPDIKQAYLDAKDYQKLSDDSENGTGRHYVAQDIRVALRGLLFPTAHKTIFAHAMLRLDCKLNEGTYLMPYERCQE